MKSYKILFIIWNTSGKRCDKPNLAQPVALRLALSYKFWTYRFVNNIDIMDYFSFSFLKLVLSYLIYLTAEQIIKYTNLSLDPPNMTLQLTSGLESIVWELLNYVRGHKTITCNQVFLTRQNLMSLKILFNMSIY